MFDPAIVRIFEIHAEKVAPLEACAFIIDGKVEIQENISPEPMKHFQISDRAYLEAVQTGKLQAVLHSHTYREEPRIKTVGNEETMVMEGIAANHYPSKMDMQRQIGSALPWGITVIGREGFTLETFWWGPGIEKPRLIGRPFRHGVTDCYSLLQDYFELQGVKLPDVAREFHWWDNGENMYVEAKDLNGFVQILPEDVKAGDVALMKMFSPVPNHVGIYVGNDLLLHHLQHTMSKTVPCNQYMKRVVGWYRHKDMFDKEAIAYVA